MERYKKLDVIRGITIISMILYHGIWDITSLFQYDIPWYNGIIGHIWQQSICWTFILLSGYCWSLGKHHIKNGIIVSIAGTIVTIVTLVVMPEERVIFGVLTMLGCSMLLLTLFEGILDRIPPAIGTMVSIFLLAIFKNINEGSLGIEKFTIMNLPDFLYKKIYTTFLGFPEKDFYSTDYFSMIPWFFLYVTGFYIYKLLKNKKELLVGKEKGWRVTSWIGKHSLLIYMLHQPLIYGIMEAIL